MSNPEKIILYSSDEAAKLATVTGWVDRHGRFFGDDENMARWSGATHVNCKTCKGFALKGLSLCSLCDEKRIAAEKKVLPWNYVNPITTKYGDERFFTKKEVLDWLRDNHLTHKDVEFFHCAPLRLSEVSENYFGNNWTGDVKLPTAVAEALAALNATIRASEHLSWLRTDIAVDPKSLKGPKVPK